MATLHRDPAGLATPLWQERLLSGWYDGCAYEGCLEAALLPDGLRLSPARWVSRNEALTLSYDDLISVYVHASRVTPRLEFIYRAWGGTGTAHLVPRNLRAWVRHLADRGVPVRPAGLDPERLPNRSLHSLVQRAALAALAGVLGAGGLLALLQAVP